MARNTAEKEVALGTSAVDSLQGISAAVGDGKHFQHALEFQLHRDDIVGMFAKRGSVANANAIRTALSIANWTKAAVGIPIGAVTLGADAGSGAAASIFGGVTKTARAVGEGIQNIPGVVHQAEQQVQQQGWEVLVPVGAAAVAGVTLVDTALRLGDEAIDVVARAKEYGLEKSVLREEQLQDRIRRVRNVLLDVAKSKTLSPQEKEKLQRYLNPETLAQVERQATIGALIKKVDRLQEAEHGDLLSLPYAREAALLTLSEATDALPDDAAFTRERKALEVDRASQILARTLSTREQVNVMNVAFRQVLIGIHQAQTEAQRNAHKDPENAAYHAHVLQGFETQKKYFETQARVLNEGRGFGRRIRDYHNLEIPVAQMRQVALHLLPNYESVDMNRIAAILQLAGNLDATIKYKHARGNNNAGLTQEGSALPSPALGERKADLEKKGKLMLDDVSEFVHALEVTPENDGVIAHTRRMMEPMMRLASGVAAVELFREVNSPFVGYQRRAYARQLASEISQVIGREQADQLPWWQRLFKGAQQWENERELKAEIRKLSKPIEAPNWFPQIGKVALLVLGGGVVEAYKLVHSNLVADEQAVKTSAAQKAVNFAYRYVPGGAVARWLFKEGADNIAIPQFVQRVPNPVQ